jgi:glycosyltransferase involved in cell wall biosynthesis
MLNWLRHWPEDQALRPVVIVRRSGDPLQAELPDRIPVVDLRVHGTGLWPSAIATLRLARIIASRKPEIVVALLSLPSVALATRLACVNTKLIASLQNPIIGSEAGFISTRKRPFWVPQVCTWSYKLCDQLWAIAPGLAFEATETFRAPVTHTRLLPNSVDIGLIAAKAAEFIDHPAFADPTAPVIVTACRLAWQKRVDILLRAFAKVRQHSAANLVILGDGPLRSDLQAQAEALGISDHTYFLGVRSNPWQYIAKASVFALASDFEGLGNVIIEAMACGTPVVATRAWPGTEYLITHESTGVLVPRRDPVALADGILRMLTESSLRKTCIGNGIRRASEFDIPDVMQQMNVFLGELLQTGA